MKRPASAVDDSDSEGGRSHGSLSAPTESLPGIPMQMDLVAKGLNVKRPFAQWLVQGRKSTEVRKYQLCTHGTDEVMFVVQTKRKPSDITKVVGMVEFFEPSESTVYRSMEEFEQGHNDHLCCAMDAANCIWDFAKPLFGWKVKTAIEFVVPVELTSDMGLPKRSMLGWMSPVQLKVTVKNDDLDKVLGIGRRHRGVCRV